MNRNHCTHPWTHRLPRLFTHCQLAVCLLLAAVTAAAQDLPAAKPETVGLSTERLQRISTAVQRAIDEKRIAGAVTLVARRGRVAWLKSQGMLDREAGTPMQTDSIFRICSMTKPITSLAVMMLYEEGNFLLDDPVSKYIPEFKNPKVLVKASSGQVPAAKEITIRNLLTHTSGLTYHWNSDLGAMYKDANVSHGLLPYHGTIQDNVRHLAALPLLFNPGERFEYSLGIDVLGYLVEVVSHKTLDEIFRTRIFEPLGMGDTYFYPPENKLNRLAAAYTFYPDKGLNRFPDSPIVEGNFSYSADYPYRGAKKLYSGGGGLCSTASDYARFCQMMLDGGKSGTNRLLSRKSVELMTTDHLGKVSPSFGFGLGFGVNGVKSPLSELGSPGEYNWGGFFYTAFSIDPKEQMITIFMAQLHPAGELNLDRLFHTLAYQAIID
ncbi:MAG: serine hydrolase [Acidobacteria bacterium]|nr:MAG: serine hydrolase [Acidobacteriota bacterium]